jgi:cytochrome c oxidase assembly factor CtaG
MSRLAALAGAAAAILGVVLLWHMADQLFSAHMGQHLLLVTLAAPLLVLAGLEIRMPPLAGWGLFITVFVFWHWPVAFQWAAGNVFSQVLELVSILAAAICFWSGVLGTNRLNDGARALLVMTAAVLTDLPGVVMLFAPRAICVMPGENAAPFGLTPLSDQQLAGLLMWVPANLVFFGVATLLFARWISSSHSPLVTP